MHLHYFTLKKLATQLHNDWKGSRLHNIFTQDKNEIVIRLVKQNEQSIFIRVNCGPKFPCIWPTAHFAQAKKNTFELWEEIQQLKVESILCIEWDRVLTIKLEKQYTISLKMYGNKSNVILLKEEKPYQIFRNKITEDHNFHPTPGYFRKNWQSELGNNLAIPPKELINLISPALGKSFHQEVEKRTVKTKSPAVATQQLINESESGKFYVTKEKSTLKFYCFKPEKQSIIFDGVIEAIDFFIRNHYQLESYKLLYHALEKKVVRKYKELKTRNLARDKGIEQLKSARNPEEYANIIMANLHKISDKTEKIQLFDFYNGKPITIKLKKQLTPQENAAQYYENAKKQKKRMKILLQQKEELAQKQAAAALINDEFEELPYPENIVLTSQGLERIPLKSLREFQSKHFAVENKNEAFKSLFHQFDKEGFKIYVGKNAANNDQLTFSFAQKHDLWLHARDVPGSHVIIRRNKEQQVPKTVLEYAAGLAALNSKRKHESLVPVLITEKKYVRKPKKAAPGQVIVNNEKVIMVEPAKLKK